MCQSPPPPPPPPWRRQLRGILPSLSKHPGATPDSNSINFYIFVSSWLFIDPFENHYATQTLKFNHFINQAFTMLDNLESLAWQTGWNRKLSMSGVQCAHWRAIHSIIWNTQHHMGHVDKVRLPSLLMRYRSGYVTSADLLSIAMGTGSR